MHEKEVSRDVPPCTSRPVLRTLLAMIEVDSLRKSFRSWPRTPREAVAGVSFVVPPGRVTGLLGPNGAGKTTLLRVVSTALRPTAGAVRVDGADTVRDAAAVRRMIGFLTGQTALYDRLTPLEHLRFFGRLHGLSDAELRVRIDMLVDRFALGPFLHQNCGTLSTGQKQRAGVARALVHDPPIVILDEPTTGVDVPGRQAFHELIRATRAGNRTVLFSTHDMEEVATLCDNVVMLHEGRLVFDGPLAEFHPDSGTPLEASFLARMQAGAS